MAFIQCECGERMELGQRAVRVACRGCGKRFTLPAIEPDASVDADMPIGSAGTLAPKMVEDHPAGTPLEKYLAHSIVASSVVADEPAAVPAGHGSDSGCRPNSENWGDDNAEANKSTVRAEKENAPTSKTGARPRLALAPELQPGARLLDRYEIHRQIGQGGMSTIFEAFDSVRDEKVALKVLQPYLAANKSFQERFLQEGRIASSFSHPGIARVYDLHQTESLVFISMELLQGSTLQHNMNRRKDQRQSYRPQEVIDMLKPICQALEAVHAQKVVHRDLKPDNLWLSLDGSLKIMDFGIARDRSGVIHTQGNQGSGTPYFMAPEQFSASPNLDGRADQYSVAVILYELLTGELPQGAIIPPHRKNAAVPKKMSKAIYRALSTDPKKRYASMQAFYEAARFMTRRSRLAKVIISLAVVLTLAGSGFAFANFAGPLLDTKPLPIGADVPRQTTSSAMAMIEGSSTPPSEKEFTVDVRENVDPSLLTRMEMVNAEEHAELQVPIQAEVRNDPKTGLRDELPGPPTGMFIDARNDSITSTPNENQGQQQSDVPIRGNLDEIPPQTPPLRKDPPPSVSDPAPVVSDTVVVDPTPATPTPVEPTPVEPTPVEPTLVESIPTAPVPQTPAPALPVPVPCNPPPCPPIGHTGGGLGGWIGTGPSPCPPGGGNCPIGPSGNHSGNGLNGIPGVAGEVLNIIDQFRGEKERPKNSGGNSGAKGNTNATDGKNIGQKKPTQPTAQELIERFNRNNGSLRRSGNNHGGNGNGNGSGNGKNSGWSGGSQRQNSLPAAIRGGRGQ